MTVAAAPTLPQYLTSADAAKVLSVSPQTLARWRMEGVGPDWIKVSRNVVRYERTALDRYLESRTRASGGPS
jgi:hypothetical protein